VAADDLSAPLGQNRTPRRQLTLPLVIPQAVVGILSLFVVILAGWAMIVDEPFGGEPWAVATADFTAARSGGKPDDPSTRAASQANGAPANAAVPVPPGSKTITIIDGISGKREDIVIPSTVLPGSPDAKETKSETKSDTKSDTKSAGGIDQRLIETSRHGPLPKVATDGTRASDVYARPVKGIAGKPNAPRIAIVVGGLGIGGAATSDALSKLPGPVTLAFAPYGSNLDDLAARARGEGHEVLLQVPMEPFDYPDNDPGPQTLLTSLEASQNIDRLHWLMSRFQGYVGIANLMGARFTSSEPALAPVLREASKRGLLYLDDGSSQRSLVSQIAGANNLAFGKADAVIDAVPTAADVDRVLGRLETIARERGTAVGMASALPVSIERIASWAKTAEARGVLLVPISAVAKRPTADGRKTTENKR
jgi:polysaccharide deacetylase 2 family uncharacterized protein YibQ